MTDFLQKTFWCGLGAAIAVSTPLLALAVDQPPSAAPVATVSPAITPTPQPPAPVAADPARSEANTVTQSMAVPAGETVAAQIDVQAATVELTAGKVVEGQPQTLAAPTTSDIDTRSYQVVKLANGLQVLLISDPETDKAAAALDVSVGAGDDPANRAGLAHFLEHMLFLGTKKYPKPDEYQQFISSHGGSHNAYTSLENTNYFFEIDPKQLAQALDRFAQFFIAPSFDAQYVEREKHAVHSEYVARIKDDERRYWDVLRQMFDPANPAAKFSVGSLETLKDVEGTASIRDDLLAFYQQHYSAERMRLVVVGREPLDQLYQMVLPLFEKVPVYPAVEHVSSPRVFKEGLLPAEVQIQSLRSERTLTLLFPLPSQRANWRNKPASYVSYLLGHEGEGSLYQLLKSRGLAESLFAGLAQNTRDHALFAVSVGLTEEGLAQRETVQALIFEAINVLQEKGVERWRHEEMKALNDIAFRFAEKTNAVEVSSGLAAALQEFPSKDVLRAGYMLEHYDESELQGLLAELRPNNLLVTVSAPTIKGDQTTDYYQVPYRVRKLSEQDIARWQRGSLFTDIKLPAPNPFTPQSLKLKQAPILGLVKKPTMPKHMIKDQSFNVWFMKDEQFKVPRGSVMVYAKTELASSSVRNSVLSELFVRLLNDHLNSMLYTAQLAGLDFSISKRARGIAFDLIGYNEKQGLLLKSVMETFRNPVFEEERFKLIKKEWEEQLHNQDKRAPYLQTMRNVPISLTQGQWHRQLLLEELARTSLKDVQMYVLDFNRSITVDMLVYGNYYKADADNLAKMVNSSLGLHALKRKQPGVDVVKLEPAAAPWVFVDALPHDDAAIANYYQAADDSVESQAKMMLLAQVLSSPYFQALRTEQHLGYIVSATYMPLARVPGVSLLVQSPSHGVDDIYQRSRAFLTEFYQFMQAQDDAWFTQQRQAVLTQLAEKPVNQVQQAIEYWNQLSLSYDSFDVIEKQVLAISQLDKQQILALYQQTFLAEQRRELITLSAGAKKLDMEKLGWQPVTDWVEFKKTQPQYTLQ